MIGHTGSQAASARSSAFNPQKRIAVIAAFNSTNYAVQGSAAWQRLQESAYTLLW